MMSDKNPSMNRRDILRTIGTSTAVAGIGLGAFSGTAAAWTHQRVDFLGCSEVRLVVGHDDIRHDPPAVVRVVVAMSDGSTDCRDVEVSMENTTYIPGRYGPAPVRSVTVEEGEKVLGVIFYNYNRSDRFSSASCIFTNGNQCAWTPDTPALESVACVEAAKDIGGYDCEVSEFDNNPNRRLKRLRFGDRLFFRLRKYLDSLHTV